MTARILAGSVFDVLPTIPKGSVDVVCTSPPYWMLRSYLPKGHELKPLELGSEPTVQEFIANMVRVFGLVRETMADHAVCFLNIGDSYSGSSMNGGTESRHPRFSAKSQPVQDCLPRNTGIESGNLCLIPQRLAIALQDDGWIIRSVIVWHKPAPIPASVSGWMWKRCRVKVSGRNEPNDKRGGFRQGTAEVNGHDGSAHRVAQWADCPGCEKCEPNGGLVLRRGSWRPTSSWEPILLLAKSPKYYCDGEAVKTPSAAATVSRNQYSRVAVEGSKSFVPIGERRDEDGAGGRLLRGDSQFAVKHDHETTAAGANPRDVQSWAAEPLKERHYAAFPSALVRFCLRAGTSAKGYCPTCGAPWARILEATPETEAMRAAARNGQDFYARNKDNSHKRPDGQKAGDNPMAYVPHEQRHSVSNTVGWKQTCSCTPAEPRPALVLDPFAGSGRTLLTANRMGLDAVGVELNPEYIEMAERLLKQDSPLFSWTEAP